MQPEGSTEAKRSHMNIAAQAPPITIQVAVSLTAIIRPETGVYSAEVPALLGCFSQGETLDKVQANLREAVDGWLAVAHDEALAKPAI